LFRKKAFVQRASRPIQPKPVAADKQEEETDMERRKFLASSLAASLAANVDNHNLIAAQEKGDKSQPEYYELRLYHLRSGPKQKLFDDFYRQAALPAMNRNGIAPVGAFNVVFGPDSPTVFVLLPFKSIEAFASANEGVRADADYQKAGAAFINAAATDPAYTRVESSLMVAFDGMPRLEVPPMTAGNKPRIFELRTYESHSKKANKKKIEMFNRGEIAIFRRTGLRPVFFGETMVGAKLPSLTYMLVFDDMQAREKNWAVFRDDPEWKKMSTSPDFADIVSNISNVILRPTPYSQI
jgi:NIPSNAP